MLSKPCLAVLLFGLVASVAEAQSTWVVDVNNGPGTDYATLREGVGAAVAGDVVVLRADPNGWIYEASGSSGSSFPLVVPHGLTIVGVGGRPLMKGILRVENLPANEHLFIRNVQLAGTGKIRCGNCFGGVHLQEVVRDENYGPFGEISFYNCRLVTLTDCYYETHQNAYEGVAFTECDLVCLRGTRLYNKDGNGIRVRDSRVIATDCELWGRPPRWLPGTPALDLYNSTLELAGSSQLIGDPFSVSSSGVSPSQIVVGPNVTLGPMSLPWTSSTLTTMGAHLDAASTLNIEVHGAPLGIGVLSFGEPTTLPTPLWGEDYWLLASTVSVFDFVLLDADGAAAWQGNVSPSLPPGMSVWLQSAILDSAGAFALTTPAAVTTP